MPLFDWFINLRVTGRKNRFSQSYQSLSAIDDKLLVAIALYREGLGIKSVSNRLFNGNSSCAVRLGKRLKTLGILEPGRKSPAWLGLTQAKACEQQTYGKLMKQSFEMDHREWKRAEKEYNKTLWAEPKWKSQSRKVFNNPNQRIRFYLRKRLRHAAKGAKRYSLKIQEIVGCSPEQLRIHLESQFLPWMTWSNHGEKWHIDHEIPCRAFDLTDPEQAKRCFHYSNLRPLEAKENIRKSDKLPNGTRARAA